MATLACRVGGKRLFGKPLQNLDGDTTILDQIIATIGCFDAIAETVLAIAPGEENYPFQLVAKENGLRFVIGDEKDVLKRLILAAQIADATDVFRVTTECPFMYHEAIAPLWHRHVTNGNDVTTVDQLPLGTHFEIFRLDALVASHEKGTEHHRSEGCSRYIREHRGDFQVEVAKPADDCARPDLRLTVDYPEDLVVCRQAYGALSSSAPLISLRDVIAFLDGRPDLRELVAPYVSTTPLWTPPDSGFINIDSRSASAP